MKTNRELFIQWYIFQLKTYDCDSAIYAMKYLVNRMELKTETPSHPSDFRYAIVAPR